MEYSALYSPLARRILGPYTFMTPKSAFPTNDTQLRAYFSHVKMVFIPSSIQTMAYLMNRVKLLLFDKRVNEQLMLSHEFFQSCQRQLRSKSSYQKKIQSRKLSMCELQLQLLKQIFTLVYKVFDSPSERSFVSVKCSYDFTI